MEKGYSLNIIEDEQFKNILSTRPKDQKVQQLSLKYYSQFKKHQSSIQSDKIVLYLKCAYYLAQKSLWITDLNGQKIRNAGLSLNQLLKKHTLEDVMITLKQFSKRINIEDPQTLDDLQKLIKQISFLITFYSKFQKVLLKLQLKEKNPQYSQTLAELVWLLYIQSKNKLLNRSLELIDNTCMLAHALCFVLVYSWQYHQPGFFIKGENNLQKLTSRKEINARIHQKVLEFFLIKNVEYYKNMAERFEAYFSYLKNNGVIKMAPGKDNFLSPEFIQGNYKRLDYFYQKKLDYNYLDERIFFKDRTSNLTPNKFTPFARQKIHIPTKKLSGNINGLTDRTMQQGNYMSHRILSYQNMENQIQENALVEVPAAEIKFPKNIMQTPLNSTTPLIQQTPYTTGIMMYNYVNQLSSRLQKKKFASRQVDQVIFQLIDEVLKEAIKDQNAKSKQIKRNQIFSVYKLVAEDFMLLYPQQVESQQAMKSILLVSTELVFFVSNIDVSFDKLQQQFNLSYISLWRAVDFFLKFDPKGMHVNIKVHLLDLEVQIISEKIWKDSENVANIQNFLMNQKFSTKEVQAVYEKLCRRILHQIAFQIIQLSKNIFENKDQEEAISEIAFDTMKQILLSHPYMIWHNNFDQIIMCTIFSISRVYKLNVKFQNVRDAYLLCNAHLSDQKKLDMFTNIEYSCENGEADNNKGIIGFYNSCYVVAMNSFVKNKCHTYTPGANNGLSRPSTQRTLQQKDVNILLQSPISGIIPKDVSYGIKKIGTGSNNTKMMPQMKTTNTPRLHAYTESPLLKNDIVPVKNPINSRKAINFEQAEKMLTANTTVKKEQSQVNDPCNYYPKNTETSTFFNTKKFATSNRVTIGSQTPSLIKSPCNGGTVSPATRQSPSARVTNEHVIKQNSNFHNIYTNKRQYGTKNVINNR